jgi:hypothetical protein
MGSLPRCITTDAQVFARIAGFSRKEIVRLNVLLCTSTTRHIQVVADTDVQRGIRPCPHQPQGKSNIPHPTSRLVTQINLQIAPQGFMANGCISPGPADQQKGFKRVMERFFRRIMRKYNSEDIEWEGFVMCWLKGSHGRGVRQNQPVSAGL